MNIAFFFAPESCTEKTTVECVPFVANTLHELHRAGHSISFHYWHDPELLNDSGISGVTAITHALPSSTHGSLARISRKIRQLFNRLPIGPFRGLFSARHDLIVAYGPEGLLCATKLWTQGKAPIIYMSDEYPSDYRARRSASILARMIDKVDYIIVPDGIRYYGLLRDLGKAPVIPYAELPNCIPGESKTCLDSVIDQFLDRLPTQHFCICFGLLGDWTCIHEIVCTLPQWPSDMSLVLHTRADDSDGVKATVSTVTRDKRVVWSDLPLLTPGQLTYLVSKATASICFYRNSCQNLIEVGKSSGKILQSLRSGTPVICNDYPSLHFIGSANAGINLPEIARLPEAVTMLADNIVYYRQKVNQVNQSDFNPHQCWLEVANKIRTCLRLDI